VLSVDQPLVFCVILNWNGWRDTNACLNALQDCTYRRLHVLVVDNGSTDNSPMKIREAHPSVQLIETKENLGFAGGNNIGIRQAIHRGADYIWLLNNDTEPRPDALCKLVEKARTSERIGAVSSVCFYATKPNAIQVWGGTRVNLWIGYTKNSIIPRADEWFDALYGASLLLNAQALENVGILDEGFFLYWEETEMCLRLRKYGWKLAAARDSHVLHKVNGSTDGNGKSRDRYFTASGLRILHLYSMIPPLSMFFFIANRIAKRLARLDFSQIDSIASGISDYAKQRPVMQKIV